MLHPRLEQAFSLELRPSCAEAELCSTCAPVGLGLFFFFPKENLDWEHAQEIMLVVKGRNQQDLANCPMVLETRVLLFLNLLRGHTHMEVRTRKVPGMKPRPLRACAPARVQLSPQPPVIF